MQPWGGLGLTTGLLDVDSLADALELVLNDGEPISVLDTWARARHAVWKDIVDPTSTDNLLRCLNIDPDHPEEDTLFRALMENGDELKKINHTFDKEMITRMRDMVGAGNPASS